MTEGATAPVTDDFLLLREYVIHRSQEAFAQLVERHVAKVFASARRQVGEPHLAEDVTQRVFVLLATKAHTLTSTVVLSAWLLSATRYVASNARLVESRRRRHERKAAAMKTESLDAPPATAGEWGEVEPALDAAMAELSPPYRDALALRYFDALSMAEVAEALKLTEEAARQRVSRAVRQLRTALQAHGARVTLGALPALLLAHAASASPPPVGLAASIVNSAASAPRAAAATAVPQPPPKPLLCAAVVAGLLGFAVLVALAMREPDDKPYTPAKPPVALSVPGMDDVNVRTNLPFAKIPEGELWLDVYTPAGEAPAGGWPTVVLVHGGPVPMSSHPKDWPVYQHYGRLLAASGLAAVTFNYRFTSDADREVAAGDVRALLEFVRSNAKRFGLNGDRVALWAFSGGGVQLAEPLRTRPEYVRCVVSFYAMLPAPAALGEARNAVKAADRLPMLVARMGKDLPELNRRLDEFKKDAERRGIALELVEYADGEHAFDIDQDTDESRGVIRRAIEFLGKHLKPS